MTGFDELVAEGAAAPVEGWDFGWFEGRATEERPPWGYARRMGERMARAEAALDIETGGGEVLATVARPPALLVATEGWWPNVSGARRRLRPLGARVVAVADAPALPFVASSFDLVVSRHPTVVLWGEIARVLRPGGTYLAQLIGPGTNRELTDFMMGPQPVNQSRSAARARAGAESAGLEVVDLRAACAARRVLRRRRRGALPAQGALDGAGVHPRGLRRRAPSPAPAHRAGGPVRVHRAAAPRRGAPPGLSGAAGSAPGRRCPPIVRRSDLAAGPAAPAAPAAVPASPGVVPRSRRAVDPALVGRVPLDRAHRHPAGPGRAPAAAARRRRATAELAGWWRRFGGYVLDTVIVDVASSSSPRADRARRRRAPCTTAGGTPHHDPGAQVDRRASSPWSSCLGYPYLLLRFRGQTVGMMAAGVRAVDRRSGAPLTRGPGRRAGSSPSSSLAVTVGADLRPSSAFNHVVGPAAAGGDAVPSSSRFAGLATTAPVAPGQPGSTRRCRTRWPGPSSSAPGPVAPTAGPAPAQLAWLTELML